jgi:DNA-binding response OmpR family regulator
MSARVLIVDDDPDLLIALRDSILLRLTETAVDTAPSGPAALEKITVIDYDAIMTDLKMPGMDGLTLMHEILKQRPRTPTLVMTGHGEHDLAVKSLQTGAYAFLHKPLDRDFLVAWLKRAIKLRHLTRDLEESEARFRILADAAFEGIALTEHGRIVDLNLSFLLMFGYARDEAISMTPMEFHPPEFGAVSGTDRPRHGATSIGQALSRTDDPWASRSPTTVLPDRCRTHLNRPVDTHPDARFVAWYPFR